MLEASIRIVSEVLGILVFLFGSRRSPRKSPSGGKAIEVQTADSAGIETELMAS